MPQSGFADDFARIIKADLLTGGNGTDNGQGKISSAIVKFHARVIDTIYNFDLRRPRRSTDNEVTLDLAL